jgi:hypothetical protein
MGETYTGEVRNGVVVFEGSAPAVPSGTKVRIELIEPIETELDSTPTLAERYASIIGIVEGLPADMAEEHDHYIHGTPRRSER